MSLTRLIRTISYSGQSSCADSVVYPGAAGFQAALCPATSLCRFLPCVTFSSMPPPLLRFLLCASSSPSLSLLLLLPFACSFAPPPLRFLLCAASSPSLSPLRLLPFACSFAPPPLRFLLCAASSSSLSPLRRLLSSACPPSEDSPFLCRLPRLRPGRLANAPDFFNTSGRPSIDVLEIRYYTICYRGGRKSAPETKENPPKNINRENLWQP